MLLHNYLHLRQGHDSTDIRGCNHCITQHQRSKSTIKGLAIFDFSRHDSSVGSDAVTSRSLKSVQAKAQETLNEGATPLIALPCSRGEAFYRVSGRRSPVGCRTVAQLLQIGGRTTAPTPP